MSVFNNKVKLERGKMKDEILRKYVIPILRVCTSESGEEFTSILQWRMKFCMLRI